MLAPRIAAVSLLIFGIALNACAQSQVITLATNSVGPSSTIELTIASNQTAQLLYANVPQSPQGSLTVSLPGGVTVGSLVTQGQTVPPTFAGPAIFKLTVFANGGPSQNGLCTFSVNTLGTWTNQICPSTAVVIPADSGGPVNIILESSVDLITWTSALPGIYGTSTTNRFFRVRAERQ